MAKKNEDFEEDDYMTDEDMEVEDAENTDYEIPELKDETVNKRRLIEEKLDEYRLRRELEEDFDF